MAAAIPQAAATNIRENAMADHYFQYGQQETDYLKRRDKRLASVINAVGHIQRAIIPDAFIGLMHAITGQQISSRAHASIWKKFNDVFSPLTPAVIAAARPQELQLCGISARKGDFMRAIAAKFVSGELDHIKLSNMDDERLAECLNALRGVGPWTAQMMLIFTFHRPDVLSYGDLAILRGLRMLYRHKEISPQLFARYKKRYSPYSTIASFYLWEIASGDCGLSDPASHVKRSELGASDT